MANRQLTQGQIASYNASPATRISGTGSQLETDVNGNLKVVNVAGSALIGTVAIDQTTPGTTNRIVAAGVAADNAAASGNPVQTGAVYNSSAQTYSSGDIAASQADVNGNLLSSLGTALSSSIDSVTSRTEALTYTYISTATTTTAKSGSGFLHTIVVNGGTAGTIIVYDNTAGSGTIIASFDSTNALATYTFDVAFGTGLTVVTSAATKVSVSWR